MKVNSIPGDEKMLESKWLSGDGGKLLEERRVKKWINHKEGCM